MPNLIWDNAKNNFMLERKSVSNIELFNMVIESFPELNGISYNAFLKARSRAGACSRKIEYKPRRKVQLYGEKIKGGYVLVKTENGDIPKQKYIYMNANPDYKETKGDQFIFLDGNKRNFEVNNIYLLRNRERGVFQMEGGVVPGNPEATKLNILKARLKLARLDVAEKAGLTCDYGNGRRLWEDMNTKARNYNRQYRQEHLEHCRERSRNRYKNMTPEQKQRYNEYHKKWYLKKKGEKKQ